jgi:hypothetical protein
MAERRRSLTNMTRAGNRSEESILASWADEFATLKALASSIGVMSFGALALLVAVVAIFIELSRDRIVIRLRFHSRVLWSARLLAAECIVWLLVEFGHVIPIELEPFVPRFRTVFVFIESVMLFGVGVVTVLLTGVVREVSEMVKEGYRQSGGSGRSA